MRRKTGFLTKILIALTVLCCIAILVSQRAQLQDRQARIRSLEDQAAQLGQSIENLKTNIAGADTPEGVAAIAREMLGLALPGEIIFTDTAN